MVYFDIVLAVTLDYHNEDVPPEVQQELDDRQFQWSMVIGRLRGPGGDASIMGSSVTIEYEGEIRHTLSILERMDDQGFDDIELMNLDYYRIAWPACTDGDGNILETDVLYDTCIETARIEMTRELECLMDVMVNGGTVAVFLNTTCWGLNIIGTGGIATPACLALGAASIAWFACIMTKAQNLGSAYRAARSCCCNLLNCRVDSEPGGPACPSIATCSLTVDFCGDTPCMPGF